MQNTKDFEQPCQRTDIATECVELAYKNSRPDSDGIISSHEDISGIICDTVEITKDEGANKLQKPKGKYITLDVGKIWNYSKEDFEIAVEVCAHKLAELLPAGNKKGGCLLACLGNRQITADSQGPMCADHFIVTRHIKDSSPKIFSELGLFETMCITPDVLGNTGIEAALTIKGVVEKTKPDFVIAVDSLASRKTSRLATTLQMSNAGITPGSGVGNHRTALSAETLGVPVISIGIPTVVDAVTVGADILEEYFSKCDKQTISPSILKDILDSVLESGSYGYFVTPKNADEISKAAARLIGMTINKALNPELSCNDIEDLL